MSTTTRNDGNTATTWHDLRDQLTPQQIAELEDWERQPGIPPQADGSAPDAEALRQAMLHCAREHTEENLAAVLYADLPVPPDATTGLDDWLSWGDGEYLRFFNGTNRTDGPVRVYIDGYQNTSGKVVRSIKMRVSERVDDEMTPATARKAAAMLMAAADELDRLTGDAPPAE